MRTRLGIIAAFGVLLLVGVTQPGCGPGGLNTLPPDTGEDDTSLGPGDVFEVRVYGEDDLESNYRVEENGTIDFPYLGTIEVAELEPAEVADLIETRLRDEGVLVNPQVSVMVSEYADKLVSVIGAVRNPGNYSVTPGLTALQSVGLAGGTTALADRDGAVLTRRVSGTMRRYSVPLDQISVGDHDDVPIRAGDIVLIPERPF